MGTKQEVDDMDAYKLKRRELLIDELAYLDSELQKKRLINRPAVITKQQWSLLMQAIGKDGLEEIFKRH